MSTEPLVPSVTLPPVPGPFVRVEYVDFQDVAEHREFRLRAYGRDGSTEFRFAIAIAAFAAEQVSLQDGPNVCYQKLLRVIAAGETAIPDVITIDGVELASYREAHTPVRKHRWSAPLSPPTPPVVPQEPPRRPSPPRLAPPLVVNDRAPGLQEGQRVSHAIFGAGVTTASRVGHTAVCFDTGGTKTFVTSMLEVDVLSAPHTWETSRRGTNRPCRVAAAPAKLLHEEVAPPAVE
jgi:hypothetical protein